MLYVLIGLLVQQTLTMSERLSTPDWLASKSPYLLRTSMNLLEKVSTPEHILLGSAWELMLQALPETS